MKVGGGANDIWKYSDAKLCLSIKSICIKAAPNEAVTGCSHIATGCSGLSGKILHFDAFFRRFKYIKSGITRTSVNFVKFES